MTRTVAVINQKGGSGKTTTVINLGACLARAGQRTLIVDLDPQSNCTSGIGFKKPEEIAISMAEVMLDGADINQTIRRYEPAGLDVACAKIDLDDINLNPPQFNRDFAHDACRNVITFTCVERQDIHISELSPVRTYERPNVRAKRIRFWQQGRALVTNRPLGCYSCRCPGFPRAV